MNFPHTISPGATSFRQIKISSNAILRLIRQIYFPSIFPAIRYKIKTQCIKNTA